MYYDHSKPDLGKLVHAFISSRLQWTVHRSVKDNNQRRLQLIQNAAARRKKRRKLINPDLRSQQWLQGSHTEIDFKMLWLVHKSLNGLGLRYLTDLLTQYRRSGSELLAVPRLGTKHGETAFSFCAARPEELKLGTMPTIFKSKLKTYSIFIFIAITLRFHVIYFGRCSYKMLRTPLPCTILYTLYKLIISTCWNV